MPGISAILNSFLAKKCKSPNRTITELDFSGVHLTSQKADILPCLWPYHTEAIADILKEKPPTGGSQA
jgi:hypothetical protein